MIVTQYFFREVCLYGKKSSDRYHKSRDLFRGNLEN